MELTESINKVIKIFKGRSPQTLNFYTLSKLQTKKSRMSFEFTCELIYSYMSKNYNDTYVKHRVDVFTNMLTIFNENKMISNYYTKLCPHTNIPKTLKKYWIVMKTTFINQRVVIKFLFLVCIRLCEFVSPRNETW